VGRRLTFQSGRQNVCGDSAGAGPRVAHSEGRPRRICRSRRAAGNHPSALPGTRQMDFHRIARHAVAERSGCAASQIVPTSRGKLTESRTAILGVESFRRRTAEARKVQVQAKIPVNAACTEFPQIEMKSKDKTGRGTAGLLRFRTARAAQRPGAGNRKCHLPEIRIRIHKFQTDQTFSVAIAPHMRHTSLGRTVRVFIHE
jgi:hypothetical protein